MKLFLHLGCGPIYFESTDKVTWKNIDNDIHNAPRVDYRLDYLTLGDMRLDNSVDAIYSCHSIEHLSYPGDVISFFSMSHNVLRDGGTLRIVVPDLTKVAGKYMRGEDLKDIFEGEYYYHHDCPAERFMYWAREWKHTVLFDAELLSYFLKIAGFNNIKTMSFNLSDVPELCGLDRFESESICMEATK